MISIGEAIEIYKEHEVSTVMKICAFCGTENQDSTMFCELCGHRFETKMEEPINESITAKEGVSESAETSVVEAEVIEMVQEQGHDSHFITENKIDNYSGFAADSKLQEDFSNYKSQSNSNGKTIILFVVAAIILLVALWVGFGSNNDLEPIIGDDLPDVPPVDMYEPNDSMDTATIAQVGTTYKGVLSSSEDKDYFCIPANGHSSLSYTFTRNSSRTIDGIGWEISHHSGGYTSSRMAWLNEKELTDEFDDINIVNGYFIIWIENTRNDPDKEEVMEFVSHTEYSITFSYAD